MGTIARVHQWLLVWPASMSGEGLSGPASSGDGGGLLASCFTWVGLSWKHLFGPCMNLKADLRGPLV